MKSKVTVVFLVSVVLFLSGCQGRKPDVIWDEGQQISENHESAQEQDPAGEKEEGSAGGQEEEPDTQQALICVDVCGAVKNPGVYFCGPEARVYEAVQMAGGLLPDADRDSVNQAQRLKDGAKIRIYSIEEAKELQERQTESGLVNLNTADVAVLCTLSGIGEARAADIIAYREEHEGFQTVEEIMNVSGIKEATFQKIKDKIVVE